MFGADEILLSSRSQIKGLDRCSFVIALIKIGILLQFQSGQKLKPQKIMRVRISLIKIIINNRSKGARASSMPLKVMIVLTR